MYFDLSDDQHAFQAALRKTLDQECDPQSLVGMIDQRGNDPAVWQCLLDFGIAGMILPEAYGGSGLELMDLALMMETVGYYGCPAPLLGQLVVGAAIALAGSDAQKSHWLPRLCSGEILATFAFDEAGTGWLADDWTMPAGLAVSGTKRYVPGAEHAHLLLVGCAGGHLLLVERQERVQVSVLESIDPTRPLANVTFDEAKAELLCREPEVAARICDLALVLLAADAFGGASRCLDMSVEYAKTREQFGRPIGQFQALKHQLANMAVALEPSRGLYWYAAHAFDREPVATATHAAAQAKAHVTDMFMQLARDAIEAHGGMGYTWEYPLHLWFKRAMFDRAVMGAPDVHRHRAAHLAGW